MFGPRERGIFRDDGFRPRPEERGLERACKIVVLVVSAFFALAAFWELADTFSAGHYASASAVCTSAENMWRWGILAPAPHNTLRPPIPSEYYCHHPWGIFWVAALFMKLFGHHAWACRLPAAIQSALTPPALYLAGRALWGPVAGAVAAASFVAVPIALSFSDMNALEVPVIFGTVLAIWGYARFRQTYARRFLALGLAALVYAVCCDWAAVVFGAGMLGAVFVSVFLLHRWTPVADRRRIAGFWGLAVGLCTLAVGAHLYTFQHFNQLNELFAQGNLRSVGANLPLRFVLDARKFWIEVSFTGFAIALGKLALPVLALRTLLRRSELEALPLAVFAMALLQYVVFKQGADIHIFWPHYFAEYFAFACAGLIQCLLEAIRSINQKFPKIAGNWPGYACLGLGFVVPLLMLPDGLRALHYGHRSGGRFNENGHLEKPDKDKVAVLEWLTAQMPANSGVILHPGMRQSLWVEWSMHRPATTVSHAPTTAATGQDRYYVADMRFMTATEQEELVENFSITALDTFLVIDRAAPKHDFHAFEIERYAPSLLEAYWVSSSHDLRRITRSPYLSWELRDRFDLTPNEPPQAAPSTFEEQRIAHNIAVSRGDLAGANHWLEELLRGRPPGPSSHHVFEDGNELVGSRLDVNSSFVYSVYFLAAGPDPSEPELVLHSVVEAAPAGSLVAKDNAVADVGMPFAIPPSRWKRGYIYASITEIIRRIGRERWYGTFRPPRGGWHDRDLDLLYLY
jgi:Dolichyl-phosphate-mannose-protein mannosyltransferase